MMNADCDTCVSARRFGWAPVRAAMLILASSGLLLYGSGQALGQSQLPTDLAGSGEMRQPSERPVEPVEHQYSRDELVEKGQGRFNEARPQASPDLARDNRGADSAADQAMDQINAIRRQMGGGVASQLEGLFDSPEQGRQHLQREFDRQLGNLVGTLDQPRAPAIQPHPPNGSSHSVCATLRQAARRLDAVAADLEEIQLYTEADQIRANARNLRLRARMMAPGRTANAVFPGGSPGYQAQYSNRAVARPSEFDLPTNSADPKIRPRQ